MVCFLPIFHDIIDCLHPLFCDVIVCFVYLRPLWFSWLHYFLPLFSDVNFSFRFVFFYVTSLLAFLFFMTSLLAFFRYSVTSLSAFCDVNNNYFFSVWISLYRLAICLIPSIYAAKSLSCFLISSFISSFRCVIVYCTNFSYALTFKCLVLFSFAMIQYIRTVFELHVIRLLLLFFDVLFSPASFFAFFLMCKFFQNK